jgi:lipid A 3-O-deacylase
MQNAGWRARPIGPLACALALTGLTNAAGAQATAGLQARVDNDGFNVWRRPAQRSDGEYTNGTRLSLELGRSPFRHWIAPNAPPCADVVDRTLRCSSTAFAIGQHIYTPAEDSQPYTYAGWRNQRPYAGWLYAAMTTRLVRRSTIRELGATVGVTGPPALADQAHREAHEIMREHTAIPVGWNTQLRFEPGVILTARQRWLLFSGRVGGVRLIDAIVGAAASAGNVLTNVESAGDVRLGINLSHPWRRARHRGPAELVGSIGVRGQAVARNIFLDGNTVQPDRRVRRVPLVRDFRGSLGLRVGPVVVAYAVTERSREYVTGPRMHTFSSLVLGYGGIPDPAQ